MIEKKEVTSETAFLYLKAQLSLSGKSLSNEIEKISLEEGKVFSIVPTGISTEHLYNFNEGGLYKIDKRFNKSPILIPIQNDSRYWLIESVKKYINQNEENFCIFENPVALPTDQYILKSKMEFTAMDKEVYYFINKESKNFKLVKEIFAVSEGYYFLCVFSIIKSSKFSTSYKLNSEFIKITVENIRSFVVRAYDGECYLIWNHR
jgi:hypothetical protein